MKTLQLLLLSLIISLPFRAQANDKPIFHVAMTAKEAAELSITHFSKISSDAHKQKRFIKYSLRAFQALRVLGAGYLAFKPLPGNPGFINYFKAFFTTGVFTLLLFPVQVAAQVAIPKMGYNLYPVDPVSATLAEELVLKNGNEACISSGKGRSLDLGKSLIAPMTLSLQDLVDEKFELIYLGEKVEEWEYPSMISGDRPHLVFLRLGCLP